MDLYDGLAGGYYRDDNRVAPYNLYARTSQLLAEAHGASRAHDIGFRFGPAPAVRLAHRGYDRALSGGILYLPLVS